MRKLLLALVLASGGLLAVFLYQQLVVEGTMGPAAMVGVGVLTILFTALTLTWALYGTRFGDIVSKLWLAGFACAISYAAIDLAAGWILIQPLSPPLVPDAYRHHRLVPNSHAEFRQQDFAYVQRVNSLGLRGAEVSVDKPAGTYRILMLGDSFTMGKGVEDDLTSSVLLARALSDARAACGGGPVEVINGGVDSYAPVLSLIALTRDLQALDPDLVILNLDVSDLAQEQAYRGIGVRDSTGAVVAVPQLTSSESTYDRIRAWTERHLFFTRVLLYYANRRLNYSDVSVRAVVTEANREITAYTLEGDTADRTGQWREIFDSIRRMREFEAAHGGEFLLTIYPWAHEITDTQWVPGREAFMPAGAKASGVRRETVLRLAAEHGIEVVDLFSVFAGRVADEKLYFDHDMHWTPAGNRAMADGLTEYLVPRQASRWCAGP